MDVQPLTKRSFRIEEFAHRNSISRAQAYVELKSGRLPDSRKAAGRVPVTIPGNPA